MRKYFILFVVNFFAYITVIASNIADDYAEVMQYFKKDDYQQTIIEGLKVLQKAKQEGDYYHLAKLYFVLGYVSESTDDFGNAIIYYLEGSRMGLLSEDVSVKSIVISMHKNLETILTDYKHYDLAKKFIKDGIELSQQYNNEKQLISLTNNLIYIYLQEEKYIEALSTIDTLRKSFDLDYNKQIQLKNKEGIAHFNLGNLEKAEICYNYIINNPQSSDNEVYALSMHNMSLIYLKRGDANTAKQYLKKVITYCANENLNFRLFKGLQDLGEIYLNEGNKNTALTNFLYAADILESSFTNNAETYGIYQWISTTYEQQGNIALALEYKEKYSEKLEEYIAQQQEITELDKKYNIQLLTDRYYDLLAADQEQKETERLAKFGIGGTASFFLIILSIMVYRQKRTKTLLAREINELHLTSEV